jgi:hypothetical protein
MGRLRATSSDLQAQMPELNEELVAVHTGLQAKVTDLSSANNDPNNLLARTGMARFLSTTACASCALHRRPYTKDYAAIVIKWRGRGLLARSNSQAPCSKRWRFSTSIWPRR